MGTREGGNHLIWIDCSFEDLRLESSGGSNLHKAKASSKFPDAVSCTICIMEKSWNHTLKVNSVSNGSSPDFCTCEVRQGILLHAVEFRDPLLRSVGNRFKVHGLTGSTYPDPNSIIQTLSSFGQLVDQVQEARYEPEPRSHCYKSWLTSDGIIAFISRLTSQRCSPWTRVALPLLSSQSTI